MIKHILFDVGSTLITNTKSPLSAINEVFPLPERLRGERNKELRELMFLNTGTWNQKIPDCIRRYSPEHLDIEDTVNSIYRNQVHNTTRITGASSALADLNAHGVEYSFLTNICDPFLAAFKQLFDVSDKKIYASNGLGMEKPNRKLFKHVINDLGIDPSTILMVGDKYDNDILPAISLGMKTMWVLNSNKVATTYQFVDLLNGQLPKPDISVTDLSSILYKLNLIGGYHGRDG